MASSDDIEIVEEPTRLSRSLLWRLQEDFYLEQGIALWRKRPVFVTSSAPFCNLYADFLLQFLNDYSESFDLTEPVFIVELGAGSGAFACRVLGRLDEKLAHFEGLRELKLHYVMTDFIDEIIPLWQDNARLKPLVERGLLDFALFRPQVEADLKLTRSGKMLSSLVGKGSDSARRNPVIFIANAFFDTIAQDAFRVDDGRLLETKVSLLRSRQLQGQPVQPEQLVLSESYGVTDASGYYGDENLNRVLSSYTNDFANASFLVPIGALRSIGNLRKLSGDNFILFTATRGMANPHLFKGHKPHRYADLTFGLNFDAIKRYCHSIGARTLLDQRRNFGYRLMINWLLDGKDELNHTSALYDQLLVRKDQIGGFLRLETLLAESQISLTRGGAAELLLSMLQMFDFDPNVFSLCTFRLYDVLEKELEAYDALQLEDLRQALLRVDDNIYTLDNMPPLGQSEDILQTLVWVWQRVKQAHAIQPGQWLTPATVR